MERSAIPASKPRLGSSVKRAGRHQCPLGESSRGAAALHVLCPFLLGLRCAPSQPTEVTGTFRFDPQRSFSRRSEGTIKGSGSLRFINIVSLREREREPGQASAWLSTRVLGEAAAHNVTQLFGGLSCADPFPQTDGGVATDLAPISGLGFQPTAFGGSATANGQGDTPGDP